MDAGVCSECEDVQPDGDEDTSEFAFEEVGFGWGEAIRGFGGFFGNDSGIVWLVSKTRS